MKQYTPLHDSLTIKKSPINGLGVFASKAIPQDTYLGITHVDNTIDGLRYFPQGVIRTPLGGFLNHSEEPNCKLVDYKTEMHLYTTELIKAGEELTLKYKLYDPVEIIDER